MSDHPVLMHTALDATDTRELADFYCELLRASLPTRRRAAG